MKDLLKATGMQKIGMLYLVKYMTMKVPGCTYDIITDGLNFRLCNMHANRIFFELNVLECSRF